MIFSGELCDKVLDGSKTVTRRPVGFGPCRYVVGKTYAVQRKRGTFGLGPRILVKAVDQMPAFPISRDEAIAEGFDNEVAFETRWLELYGAKGPTLVWRIEFELVSENVCRCGHTHVAGDDGEDVGCRTCDCVTWRKP